MTADTAALVRTAFDFEADCTATCVYLVGSWDGWQDRAPMRRHPHIPNHWHTTKHLAPGTVTFKFTYDDNWSTAAHYGVEDDGHGGLNNTIVVNPLPAVLPAVADEQDSLDSLSGAEQKTERIGVAINNGVAVDVRISAVSHDKLPAKKTAEGDVDAANGDGVGAGAGGMDEGSNNDDTLSAVTEEATTDEADECKVVTPPMPVTPTKEKEVEEKDIEERQIAVEQVEEKIEELMKDDGKDCEGKKEEPAERKQKEVTEKCGQEELTQLGKQDLQTKAADTKEEVQKVQKAQKVQKVQRTASADKQRAPVKTPSAKTPVKAQKAQSTALADRQMAPIKMPSARSPVKAPAVKTPTKAAAARRAAGIKAPPRKAVTSKAGAKSPTGAVKGTPVKVSERGFKGGDLKSLDVNAMQQTLEREGKAGYGDKAKSLDSLTKGMSKVSVGDGDGGGKKAADGSCTIC